MQDMLTITVSGHPFTLISGRRYVAGRPMMADRDQAVFPVSISDITEDGFGGSIVATVDGLTYDQANELLAAFNNGLTSFDGRVWGQETVIETDPENDPETDDLGNHERLARESIDWEGVMNLDPDAMAHAIACGYGEQGDFTEEDFEASDRAWANIEAQEKDRAARRAAGEEVDDDEDDMIFPHEEGYDPSEAPSLKDMFGDVPGF